MKQMQLKRFVFCFYLLTIAVLVLQVATAKGATSAKEAKIPKTKAAEKGKTLLSYIPTKVARLNEVLAFNPKEGNVFNLEAPNSCAGSEF